MISALKRPVAFRLVVTLMLVGIAAPAHAQTSGGGGSLTTFLNNIANILTGTMGQAFAVIAIALLGLGMMFGAVDVRRGGLSLLGIAITFSAAWVVGQITGSGGAGAGF